MNLDFFQSQAIFYFSVSKFKFHYFQNSSLRLLKSRHPTVGILFNMKNGSGICLLFVFALMECEYWIMGNPDTIGAI